jgi:hypothetical protein
MARTRALLTEHEREALRGEHDDRAAWESASRIRARIRDELPADLDALREHHPDLWRELVAAVDGARADDRRDDPGAVGFGPRDTTPRESDESAPQSAPALASVEWSELDLPGGGDTLRARQQAVRACAEHLREHGEATRADFEEVLASESHHYASERSAWKNAVADGLAAVAERVEHVDAPGEGEHRWRWSGE